MITVRWGGKVDTSTYDNVQAFWPSGDGNDAYLDKILRFQGVELGLDESVGLLLLFRLWLKATVASVLVWAILGVPGLLITIIDFESSTDSIATDLLTDPQTTESSTSSAGIILLFIAAVLGFLVFVIMLLASQLQEPIAEWRVLLSDRAGFADSVYSQISGTMWTRKMPLTWRVRRIRTDGRNDTVQNRLVVTEHAYTAYVTVFPYGTSLYLGWTMWRSRNGVQLVGRYITDVLRGLSGSRDPERQMMRTERPRAMREAIHAACREGLFVASERRDVPLEFGFQDGELPPIEDTDERPVVSGA
jgi:hypothetical protein